MRRRFIRSVVALRSIVVLMNANAVDDAAIVLKSIFEIEFQLGAIKNDRQIAVDFILQAESARLKRLKRFRDSGRPLPEGMTVEEINRQLQEDRGESKSCRRNFWLNMQKWATNMRFSTPHCLTSPTARRSAYAIILKKELRQEAFGSIRAVAY